MNKPFYIVIAGRKQVGKNTTANFFKEHLELHGKSVMITAFAEPLKRFCNDIFGISLEDMETEEGKQKKIDLRWDQLFLPCLIQDWVDDRKGQMTVRELLQYLGSNILRNRFYKNIWCDAPFKKDWGTDVVIIADCRFKNELQAARDNKALIFHIDRNTGFKDGHVSEKDLDDVKWYSHEVIVNNKSLEDLKKEVVSIVDSVCLGKIQLNTDVH